MDNQDDLAALVERAHQDSRLSTQSSKGGYAHFCNNLTTWGTNYFLWGDKGAGVKLLEEAIELLDKEINGRGRPIVTIVPRGGIDYTHQDKTLSWSELRELDKAYSTKDKAAFIRRQIEKDAPLAQLDRKTILALDSRTLNWMSCMDNYFEQMQAAEEIEHGYTRVRSPWADPMALLSGGEIFPCKMHGLPVKQPVVSQDLMERAHRLHKKGIAYCQPTEKPSSISPTKKTIVKAKREWANTLREGYQLYANELVKYINENVRPNVQR